MFRLQGLLKVELEDEELETEPSGRFCLSLCSAVLVTVSFLKQYNYMSVSHKQTKYLFFLSKPAFASYKSIRL